MANKELRTKIVLRNDTPENWRNTNPALLKGELGVEVSATGDVKLKVGKDGVATWNDLPYFGDVSAAQVFFANIAYGANKVAALEAVATNPAVGDIGIVRMPIYEGSDKIEHTAYVFDGEKWAAMDGNYHAENVYFNEDLTYTADIGALTLGDKTFDVLSAKGKSLEEVLKTILAQRIAPEAKAPTARITSSNIGEKEVGTNVTPSYTVTFNKGSYQYGPDTGITATYAVSDTDSHTATAASGSFAAFTVGDTTNYKVSVTATHTEGAIPKNNLGADAPTKKIAAGSKSANSGAITGYRNSFWGGVKSKAGTPDSATIRGLAGKKNGAIGAGNTGDAQENVGDMRVIIAVPAPRTINSIKDVNGLNAEAFSAFTHITVNVEGANGYEAKSYNVYYKDNAAACDKANKWHFTVA